MEIRLLNPDREIDTIKALWRELSARGGTSYFLSWGWIGTWLESLPAGIQPKLVLFSENGAPRIAFFVRRHSFRRHLFVKSRGLFINCTGDPLYDRVWIEYNHFLGATAASVALEVLLDALPLDWEECFLPGLDSQRFPGNALESSDPSQVIVEEDLLSHYVDLEAVRKRGGEYLLLLGKKTRANIRRSYRFFLEKGEIRLQAAQDTDAALALFTELVELHEQKWARRGAAGAFESDYMRRFHQSLIRRCFEKGEIQLLKVTAGEMTLGCVYNFLFNGKIYNYQNGFSYEHDKRFQPGFVCHAEAIAYNAGQGHMKYDFLAGDAGGYKQRLSTHAERLLWVRIQKPRFKFFLEKRLKDVKQLFKKEASTLDQ